MVSSVESDFHLKYKYINISTSLLVSSQCSFAICLTKSHVNVVSLVKVRRPAVVQSSDNLKHFELDPLLCNVSQQIVSLPQQK